MRIAETISAETTPTETVSLDLDTGTDGYFRNADDPFEPPLGWTHRLHVYDTVDAEFRARTSMRGLVPAYGPPPADPTPYRVDIEFTSVPGTLTPVPSPSPEAVVFEYDAVAPVRFLRDALGGLHAVSDESFHGRLTYGITGSGRYRGAPLSAAPFAPMPQALPPNVRRDAEQVLAVIGGVPASTFGDTVRRLHAYFAGFQVAPLGDDEQRANDYLTVALARKGVCRHRARTFFVTALAAGVPTRLVENRTHSFCEVRQPDGTWRRLEFRLGDEEGPPGTSAWRLGGVLDPDQTEAVVFGFSIALTILVGVALLALAWHGLRTDSRAHLVEGLEEDDGPGLSADDSLSALLSLVIDRSRNAVHSPVGRRVVSLRQAAASPADEIDARELQAIYWNCYHVLKWLKERKSL